MFRNVHLAHVIMYNMTDYTGYVSYDPLDIRILEISAPHKCKMSGAMKTYFSSAHSRKHHSIIFFLSSSMCARILLEREWISDSPVSLLSSFSQCGVFSPRRDRACNRRYVIPSWIFLLIQLSSHSVALILLWMAIALCFVVPFFLYS